MAAEIANPPDSTRSKAWAGLLLLVCAAILGYGTLYSDNSISDLAYLAGYYLVYALLAWAVFAGLALWGQTRKIKAAAFIAIYVAFFIGALVAAAKQQRQAVLALSSVQQELNKAVAAPSDPTALPPAAARRPSMSIHASGDFGEMERFMKEFMGRLVVQRRDYRLELAAIDWNSVLDPERIKNDLNLSESKAIIDRAKVIVGKYENKTDVLLQQTRSEIGRLRMAESMKRDMLSGFDKGMAKAKQQIDEQWRLERQIVGNVENIFNMLAASKAWTIKGGRILFYRQNDLDRFNAYLKTIQEIAAKEDQMQKIAIARANQQLDALKN